MISNLKHYKDFAFVFVIPHVSRLLIYKDNWNKSRVMRKVISEILQTGIVSKLYMGGKPNKYNHKYHPEHNDCAVVNIKIHGINLLEYDPESVEELFSKEIRNETNVLHFDSTWLDVAQNISCIDVDIKISEAAKSSNRAA